MPAATIFGPQMGDESLRLIWPAQYIGGDLRGRSVFLAIGVFRETGVTGTRSGNRKDKRNE